MRRTSLFLGLLVGLLVAVGFGIGGIRISNLHNGLIAASFTAVGLLVVDKRPGHREGSLFVAVGVAHAGMFFARQYGFGVDARARLPGAVWLAWLGTWPLALILALVSYALLCFPDGRLPSRRWRAAAMVLGPAALAVAVMSALWPVEYERTTVPLAHPLHLGGAEVAQKIWNVAGPTVYLAMQLVWVVGAVKRLRRATGDEIAQIRWFAFAVAVGGLVMIGGLVALRSPVPGVLAVPIVPIAAGVAIVKYRLYDIDLFIHRALVVGVMAASIALSYVAIVFGIGAAFRDGERWLSLIATAVVALGFEPARRRVQKWADLLVYGDRPTPYEVLARLPVQVSGAPNSGDMFSSLAATLASGVSATNVQIWIGGDRDLVLAASWPDDIDLAMDAVGPRTLTSLDDQSRTHVRAIVHRGVVRGAVALTKPPGHALAPAEGRLLDDLVAQAGLIVDNAGLGAELQRRLQQISRQAAELRAAAHRIISAQDEARRRIERDLHDGAQQRLVTLALCLQDVSRRATSIDDEHLAEAIARAKGQLSSAIAELREMARGIHPAILTEEGLEPALGVLAERAAMPVTIDFRLNSRAVRDVEAAAYFVISESLTNAAKHAHAESVHVAIDQREDQLIVEITDDGRGGACGKHGSGIQGLSDRLATLGGRLTIHSPVGEGTRVRAEIPCE